MKKVVLSALLSMGLLSGVASADIASDLTEGLDVKTVIQNATTGGMNTKDAMVTALNIAPQLVEEIITESIKSASSAEEQVALYVVAQNLGVKQETAFTSAILANVDPSLLSGATATGYGAYSWGGYGGYNGGNHNNWGHNGGNHNNWSPQTSHHNSWNHFGGGSGGGCRTISPN